LRIPSVHPWNSEPPLEALVENFFTPNDLFFVRNHNNVPDIDVSQWKLSVKGNDVINLGTAQYSLEDLKTKFPRHEVIATIQCAGNRQEDFVTEDRPLYVAPHWRNGAIGNARWAGVKVRDILRASGMDVDAVALGTKSTQGMKVINFTASDQDETGVPYVGILPLWKVIDPFGDAILAYEMNGVPLPRDHGYPVRLLAPGHAGCRNVKWVSEMHVSAKPSELDSADKLDRHFAPDVSWLDHRVNVDPKGLEKLGKSLSAKRVDISQGPVIQTLPVQSVIAVPANGARLSGEQEFIEVQGVAWSGAGRGICRVELSLDHGETFSGARLCNENWCSVAGDIPEPEQGMGRNWSWKQFKQKLPLPDSVKHKLARGEVANLEIIAKAVDGDFNSQPERMNSTWNVLGICANHWSRVNITLDPTLPLFVPPPPLPPLPPAGCVGLTACVRPRYRPQSSPQSQAHHFPTP
jgi:sulfite oxidase